MKLDKSTGFEATAAIQVLTLLIVLAWVPGNALKASALLLLWALSFGRLSRAELAMYVGICVFFTGMNASALKQGIFNFRQPDVLGMPLYELFMWGFYLLHTKRLFEGPAPVSRRPVIWGFALAYAAAFGGISDAQLLLGVTSVLLLAALVVFHEPLDLAYCGYMVVLGALVEYTGVHSGQWGYPGDIPGGVPPWFVTMWGGVGLFFRRLVLPWVRSAEDAALAPPPSLPADSVALVASSGQQVLRVEGSSEAVQKRP